ncbi:FUSC family protein [Helicobacter aurati]|uniref:FUSC family protein n=1 Tax=Helicobacter aurati TaxID=137778 RepID=A0A3D8J1Y8_9HELI|nr:FUSC family protein [Helicobacter aurati]RDU70874.1 FUSC family protein [Helicobacter aurati]
MNAIWHYLKKYVQIYDPGHLNCIYACKAMIAISLSVLFHYLIFGAQMLVWAAMTPMQVFFLNATLSQQANRKIHMLGFAICSTFAVSFFTILAQEALTSQSIYSVCWLAVPVLLLSFCVGMSRAHSIDLYRMFVPVVVNSLVACIYVDSGVFLPITEIAFVVFTSALIGIIVGFLLLDTASNYGKWTQVYYPSVLQSLKNMVVSIHSVEDFTRYKDATFLMIYNIKQTLHTKSGIYNDNYMIKNIKRAIFYIYQIEDIYMMITVLTKYNIHHNYPFLQREIIENIDRLSKIFVGRIPKIRRVQADKIIFANTDSLESYSNNTESDSNAMITARTHTAFANVLKILYYKMESFCRVGRGADLAFNIPAKKSFKNIITALHVSNATFRFSVKYSLAIGLSLVFAMLLNINRGIWISLGVVSVVRPSIGGMQNISKEYFISAAIGILIGIVISVFAVPMVFYLFFGVVIFLVVYLRVFPFWLWSGFMMCGFVMMYSILYEDFLRYVLDRLLDIGLGVVFAILVFLLLWPRYSHNNLKPIIVKQMTLLKDMLNMIIESDDKRAFENKTLQIKQADFLHNLDELKNTLKDSRVEITGKSNQIVVYGFELVNVLEVIGLRVNELLQLHFSYHSCGDSGQQSSVIIKELEYLKLRFEMIEKLLNNTAHDFEFVANSNFFADASEHCQWIMSEIFGFQNKLYKLLNENYISIPEH